MSTVNVRDCVFTSPHGSRTIAVTDLTLTDLTVADLVARVLHALRVSHVARNADFVLRSAQGILLPRQSPLYDCGIRSGATLSLEREGTDSHPLLLDARVVRDSSLERGAEAARRSIFQLDVILQEKSGRPVFRIEGNQLPACTIGDVKRLIQESCRVPAAEQRMMVGNRMRCDDERLGVCLGGASAFGGGDGGGGASVASVRVYERRLTLSIFVAETSKTVQVHGLLPSDTVKSVWQAVGPSLDDEGEHEVSAAPVSPQPVHDNDDGAGRRRRKQQQDEANRPKLCALSGDVIPNETTLESLRRTDDGGVIRVVFDKNLVSEKNRGRRRSSSSPQRRTTSPSRSAARERATAPVGATPPPSGPMYEVHTSVNRTTGLTATTVTSRGRTFEWIESRAAFRSREVQPRLEKALQVSEAAKRAVATASSRAAGAAPLPAPSGELISLEMAEAIAYGQYRMSSSPSRHRHVEGSSGSVAAPTATSMSVDSGTPASASRGSAPATALGQPMKPSTASLDVQLAAFKAAYVAERRGGGDRRMERETPSGSSADMPLVVTLK